LIDQIKPVATIMKNLIEEFKLAQKEMSQFEF
jgi:hypothetical protein